MAQETGRPNRGAKPDTSARYGRLGEVRDTKAWAWLVECGFTEADDYTVTETGAGDITISFDPVDARYVLLEITRADGESEFDLKQIQVLNTADTNVALGKGYAAEGWQS